MQFLVSFDTAILCELFRAFFAFNWLQTTMNTHVFDQIRFNWSKWHLADVKFVANNLAVEFVPFEYFGAMIALESPLDNVSKQMSLQIRFLLCLVFALFALVLFLMFSFQHWIIGTPHSDKYCAWSLPIPSSFALEPFDFDGFQFVSPISS